MNSSAHISSQSGNSGIEKIDNFLDWYQEQFGRENTDHQKPRMVLVGLGVHEQAKRMVSFLSESDLDISLTTFHGFEEGGDIFLARQVEVQSKPDKSNKKMRLEKLKRNVERFGIKDYYYDISAFFRDTFPAAAEMPSPGGYAYAFPELTDKGNQTYRVYVSLYISKNGRVRIYLQSRAIEVAEKEFQELKNNIDKRLNKKHDGNFEIVITSKKDWEGLKDHFKKLCPAIFEGWKKKREQQSQDEFESTESEHNTIESSDT